jgi:DNA-binding GntR family transcriptional regulator
LSHTHLSLQEVSLDKEKVYEDIRQQIMEERLRPGQWLVERDLCQTYGMSRTPIREVLWRLIVDGFLEQEPNKGFTVRKLRLEQVFELFQAREAIEGMEARLACRKGDEKFRHLLQELREELLVVKVEEDVYRAIMLGRRLHDAIKDAARNEIMAEIHQKLRNLTILTINLTRHSPNIENLSRNAHVGIIEAILAGEEERSEQLMREHLRVTCRNLVEQFYPGMMTYPAPGNDKRDVAAGEAIPAETGR